MDPKTCLEKLYTYTDFSKRRKAAYNPRNYNLGGMRMLLFHLGNPHKSIRLVHVAGTKGKGSTSLLLSNLCQLNGMRTGTYLSPHVLDERDRFFINHRKIPWVDFIRLFENIEKTMRVHRMRVTVFDIFTSMAFLYFQEKRVDIAIIEVGLGGRLDSTNVIQPDLCLITSIGLDHTDRLGSTLREITLEKAGIIKRKRPLLAIKQSKEILNLIREVSYKRKAPLSVIPNIKERDFSIYRLPEFQRPNLSLALAACRQLGLRNSPRLLALTLVMHPLIGRYTRHKNFLFDGAHNPFAMRRLIDSIKRDPKNKTYPRIILILYFFPDKDIHSILKCIPKNFRLYYYPLDLSYISSKDRARVFEKIRGYRPITKLGSFKDFLSLYNRRDLFVFTGSFSLIGALYLKVRRI